MKLRPKSAFFVLILLIMSISTVGFARPKVKSPLIIDGSEYQMIWVYPAYKRQNLLVDTKEISSILSQYMEGEKLERVIRELGKERQISIGKLKKLGLDASFNEDMLTFHLSIPVSLRKTTIVNLSHTKKDFSERSFSSASWSGFLNTSINQTYYDLGQGIERDLLTSGFQFVSGVKGVVLDAGVNYTQQYPSKEEHWVRDDIRLIKDDKKRMIRYMLGDLEYPTMGFQTRKAGAGISATRFFSISPQTITRALDQKTIVLKRPSIVKVFINGGMIKKLKLPAGVVDLQDIPLSTGENDVELEITDDRGKTEKISFSNLHHSSLLAPGLSEFSFNLESPYETEQYSRKYDTTLQRTTMFYRQGVSNQLTLGGNLQADKDYKLLGAEGLYLNPLGLWTTNLAFSDDKLADQGIAYRLDYQSLERWQEKRAPFIFRGSFEKMSRNFRQLGQLKNAKSFDLSAHVSKQFPFRIGAGMGATYVDKREVEDTFSVQLNLSKSLGVGFRTGINYDHGFKGDEEKRVFLSLNWSDRAGTLRSYSYFDSTTGNLSTQGQYAPIQGTHSLQTLAEVSTSKEGEQAQIQADYVGPRGELSFAHQKVMPNGDRVSEQFGQVGAKFAVAFAGSTFGIGRPITDAFALVNVEADEAVDIPVNRSSNYSLAHVDFLGPALITQMQPYVNSSYFLDATSLPVGKNFDIETFHIFPTYKEGSEINVKIESNLAMVATVKSPEKRPLKLITGKLFNMKGQIVSNFFSNRKGRVFVEKIPPGKYKLVMNSPRQDQIEIVLKDAKHGLVNLGELILKHGE